MKVTRKSTEVAGLLVLGTVAMLEFPAVLSVAGLIGVCLGFTDRFPGWCLEMERSPVAWGIWVAGVAVTTGLVIRFLAGRSDRPPG